jgi:glycosyltransferase involved in cell wall biosynthesis
MPKVSIITRTKDRPLLLERAMNSVLSQSFDDWEHIIVNDDVNKDSAYALAQKYAEQYNGRLNVIYNKTPQGLEVAANTAFEQVKGEYFVIHDDDDSWQPDFLKKTVEVLDAKPELGAVITDINYVIEEIIDNEIKIHDSYVCKTPEKITLYGLFLSMVYPPPIATLFRSECLKEVGFHNVVLRKGEDREYLLRVLKEYKIGTLSETLANYYTRPYNNQSYSNATMGQALFQQEQYWEQKLREELFKKNFDLWLYYHFVEFIRPWVEKQRISKVLKEAKGQKIALYGAGLKAAQLFKNHKKVFDSLDIAAVLDQNFQKQGALFEGLLIMPPEKISDLKPDKVIITVANVGMVKSYIEKLIKADGLNCEIVDLSL